METGTEPERHDAPPVSASPMPSALLEGAACAIHPDVPARFVCSRCGNFGCEACAFSEVPKREVCRACAAKGLGEPIPWERRKEIGTLRAFWETVKLASLSPTRFFRTPTVQPSIVSAVVFGAAAPTLGLILSYAVIAVTVMLAGGVAAAVLSGDERWLGGLLGAYGCVIAGMSPLALIFGPAQALTGAAVAAAGSHGTLALLKKTNAGFEDTLRAVCYANAPRLFQAIPVVGFFTYFWSVGLEVVALRETHRCGTDVALAAALGYRLLLFFLLIGAYAALFGMMFMLDRAH